MRMLEDKWNAAMNIKPGHLMTRNCTIIWSDESAFTLLPITVRDKPGENQVKLLAPYC